MRTIVTALLVLAAAGAVGSALYVLLLVSLVLGALLCPREFLGFAGVCILMALAERHGLALLGFLTVAVVVGAATRHP